MREEIEPHWVGATYPSKENQIRRWFSQGRSTVPTEEFEISSISTIVMILFFLILGNNNGNHRLFLHLLFLTYYFVHCLTTSLFFSFVVFFIRQSSSISSDFLNVDWTARSFFRFTMIIFHFFSFSCSFGFFPSLSTISPLACLQCVCMCLATLVQSAHMHTPWYAEKLISGTGVYPNTVE